MNEEAMRVAIAEACGRYAHSYYCPKCRKNIRYFFPRTAEEDIAVKEISGAGYHMPAEGCGEKLETYIPDYLNDLNAMHEAEKTLDPHVRNDFIAHLWSVTGNEPSANFWTEYNFRGLYACTHATAAQRAEAFLRTIGMWEEHQ